jgi:hypothetical protein
LLLADVDLQTTKKLPDTQNGPTRHQQGDEGDIQPVQQQQQHTQLTS